MRYIVLILIFWSYSSFAQISTTRMNKIKLEMKTPDFLKLFGQQPIAFVEDVEQKYTLNDVDYFVVIGRGFLSKNESDTYVRQIRTTSPKIKTLSNLGIGSSLEDLWKHYHKYQIYIDKLNDNQRSFRIEDVENKSTLNFLLKNNKVIEIEVNSYNPEECFI